MSRCRFNVDDECIAHGYSDRCYTDALPDHYCFAACPHDDGVFPSGPLLLCLNCQKQLPLGASNDDDPRVAVEIRAAELAVLKRGAFTSHEANQGWAAWHHDWPTDPPVDSQAGWLAAAIANHDENSQ